MSRTATTDSLLKLVADRVSYDALTGKFLWREVPENGKGWNTRRAGKEAGRINSGGYAQISITIGGKARSVTAHRLAFFIVNGRPPSVEIDHLNGNTTDNRIANLQEATAIENGRNQKLRSTNSSGYVGVSRYRKAGKWGARGSEGRERVFLGLFSNPKDAAKVAREWREQRGYSERHLEPQRSTA